jgi:hypothetical protein
VSLRNVGGPMPDGTRARDLWVDESDYICASGAELCRSASLFKTGVLGKLSLTRTSLVMLPYEGAELEIVKELASRLQHIILGPYAQIAEALEKLGLYPKGLETLDRVLVWPLVALDEVAQSKDLNFLGIRGGAQLIIKVKGETYYFNMAAQGRAPAGFASAQEFQNHINRLRPR